MGDSGLIAAIEEAAIIPEKWPEVLERLAAVAHGSAAALVAYGPGGEVRSAITPAYKSAFADYHANGTGYENVRPKRAAASGYPGFLTDLEVCTPEELAHDPIYERFLRPHGFGWTSGTAVPVPSGDLIMLDVSRRIGLEPFERRDMVALDAYRPHLARAALLASRLGLERARAAADTLAMIGLPAAVLATGGRLIAANAALEALAPRVYFRAFGVFGLADADANRLLTQALAGLGQPAAAQPRSIPMPALDDQPALIAHLVPLRRAACDVFSSGIAIVVVTEVTAPAAPMTELLTGLFDLTPAEARLARAVASGQALAEIAVQGSTSVQTVRSHLKAVMAKTGTRRQVDLVRLLLGASLPGGNKT